MPPSPLHISSRLDYMVAIGKVSADKARLWYRLPDKPAGRMTLAFNGQTQSIDLTADPAKDFTGTADFDNLPPNTLCHYTLFDPLNHKLTEGDFKTRPFPDPDTFSFGLMSCHQPFSTATGNVTPEAERMLDLAYEVLDERNASFIFWGGDQVYSDYPANDKFTMTERDVLKLPPVGMKGYYYDRYRSFWNLPGIQKLYGRFPSYAILDDHEIWDDWGSESKHKSQKYQATKQAALEAYMHYQASRWPDYPTMPPEDFSYSFDLGRHSFFVMDLRSQRGESEKYPIISAVQYAKLLDFLRQRARQESIFLLSSVPIFHIKEQLTNWISRYFSMLDAKDLWTARANIEQRNALMAELYKTAQQGPKVYILAGDVHIGTAYRIEFEKPGRVSMHQFVSSGVTHEASDEIVARIGGKGVRLAGEIEKDRPFRYQGQGYLMRPSLIPPLGSNPVATRNFGVVDVSPAGVEFSLYGLGSANGGREAVFRYRPADHDLVANSLIDSMSSLMVPGNESQS